MRRTCAFLGPYRVGYVAPRSMPRPCATRWDLKLAKARLWEERVDPSEKAGWQLEDIRHMSPQYSEFIGYPLRKMKPGFEGIETPTAVFDKKLPHHSAHELMNRRDVPYSDNVMWSKTQHDLTTYGTSVPYSYKRFKQMQKASRNDRKTKGNKFKIFMGAGMRNPPSGFEPQADPEEESE
jgi:hypothetical protein